MEEIRNSTSVWDTYPETYRAAEVQRVLTAVQAGESVSVLGLSGAGKSNFTGFLAHRVQYAGRFVLVDCNRLFSPTPDSFLRLVHQAITGDIAPEGALEGLLARVAQEIGKHPAGLCLLLDRLETLEGPEMPTTTSSLRALRDLYKYQLTYVIATRRPLDSGTELAELVFANTFWLGPLSASDVAWNVTRYASRRGLDWGDEVVKKIQAVSWGYPSLLRAVSEAFAAGCPLEIGALQAHPAVQRRVAEFWADDPTAEMVAASGLDGHPLLSGRGLPKTRPAPEIAAHVSPQTPVAAGEPLFDTTQFTAKEHLLFDYLRAHAGEVCEKDAIIQAVWPEDQIFEQGVRDDSLAQLVRRLRKKIEPDSSNPTYIQTAPGRGYIFREPAE